jgi:hypothetical protein
MGWAGHVAHKGAMRNAYRILARELGICKRIILKWFLNKYDMTVETGLIWHRIESSIGHSNEPMGSIKGKEFLN